MDKPKRGRKKSPLPKNAELALDGLSHTAKRRSQLRNELDALRALLQRFQTLGSAVAKVLELRRQRLPVSRSSAEIPQSIYTLNDEFVASLGRLQQFGAPKESVDRVSAALSIRDKSDEEVRFHVVTLLIAIAEGFILAEHSDAAIEDTTADGDVDMNLAALLRQHGASVTAVARHLADNEAAVESQRRRIDRFETRAKKKLEPWKLLIWEELALARVDDPNVSVSGAEIYGLASVLVDDPVIATLSDIRSKRLAVRALIRGHLEGRDRP